MSQKPEEKDKAKLSSKISRRESLFSGSLLIGFLNACQQRTFEGQTTKGRSKKPLAPNADDSIDASLEELSTNIESQIEPKVDNKVETKNATKSKPNQSFVKENKPEVSANNYSKEKLSSTNNDKNSNENTTDTPLDEKECKVLNSPIQEDLNKLPDFLFDIEFILYGSEKSALIAFEIKGNSHIGNKKIKSIELYRTSGVQKQYYAKSIFDSDMNVDNTIKNILVENLNLSGATQLTFVVELFSGERLKKTSKNNAISFNQIFEGKSVVNLLPDSLPNGFSANQLIANFNHSNEAGYIKSNDPKFVFINRKLRSAQSNATIVASSRLNGSVITDMMNRRIASNGSSFTDIISHNNFIAYKLVGNLWYRTIFKVG